MGIYVGEEDTIDLEDGIRVYILKDLSEGADNDLGELSRTKGGYSPGELAHLAITRIVLESGEECHPTLADIRRMKMEVVNQIASEVMARWFPKAYQEYLEVLAGTPSNGTSSSTPIEASAKHPSPSGPEESS